MQHRNVLGEATGHAVQRAQFTHAVGGEQCTTALHSRVAIGGIGGIQFVGAAHPTKRAVSNDVVKKLEIVVSGYAKQTLDAAVSQTVKQVICHGIGRSHGATPSAGYFFEY